MIRGHEGGQIAHVGQRRRPFQQLVSKPERARGECHAANDLI